MTNKKIVLTITGVVVFLMGLITFFSSYVVVDATEFAYKYDLVTGELKPIFDEDGKPRTGWIWKKPFIEKAHTIELLPYRVCLGEENTKVLNCKLVQFNVKGWKEFVMWHGRRSYEHNRNSSRKSDYDLNVILMAYAYTQDPSVYEFLNIEDDVQDDISNTEK